MNTKERTWKIINDLLQNCDCTELHITAIRYCDCKDNTDEFIAKAANSMQNVSFLPEEANKYDREAVSCRFGKKRIGYVATYDLEKCHILAEKNDTSLLTGHFGRFSANVEHHLLKLYINGVVTTDDISDYRRKTAEQKDKLYGSWQHDAIAPCLVRSRQQDDAIACISQLKERVLGLFSSWGTSTRDELTPVFEDYKDCSQYDISLEGQQSRWDILHYLELFHDSHREHGLYGDEFYKKLWQDIEDMNSQIGSELVRSVSYKSYIERLTKLVTELLPSSDTAQHYLNTKPSEFFEKIRQQVERFPHYLYHLFRTNIEEFVKTLYYARIPRQYLDPFLSGIALVQAYDKIHSSTESMSQSDTPNHFSKDVSNTLKEKLNGEVATEGGEDEGIVEELLPVFKDDKEAARKFLAFARNHRGTMVTERVTQLAAEKKIDNKYAKTTLHKILNQHGIYTYSLSNWNKQVKLKWD